MNYDLLRSWLGLAPGPWPPDHYTLLGLPAGHADAAAFEPRVLHQMDLLRTHQLLHPELVTEGMNRLAQALITLTDPTAKATYDADFGVAPPPAPNPLPKPPSRPEPKPESVIVAEPVFDDGLLDAEPVLEPHPTEVTQEITLPAELPPPYEVMPEPPRPRPNPSPVEPVRAKPVERVMEGRPVVRPWPTPPSSRRWIYKRLALIRKGRRAWLKLRPVLLDPHDPLDRPGRVLLLLEAARAIQPLLSSLSGVVGGIDEPGSLVASIVKQPLLLDTIRRLLPDQRRNLAGDWRSGLQELDREYDRLRTLAVEVRSQAEGISKLPLILRWVRDVPELLLIGFALIILLISLTRSALNR